MCTSLAASRPHGQIMAIARPPTSPGRRPPARPLSRLEGGRASSARSCATLVAPPAPAPARLRLSEADVASYNAEMASRMGWDRSTADPYKYDPARGIAYHHAVFDARTLCGPQPLTPDHVRALVGEHGVTHILSLQEEGDAARWGVDLRAVVRAAEEAGIRHVRVPARDFDPGSLRVALPAAAGALEAAHRASAPIDGRVFVHCTAGLGRAPAACIAHAMWFRGLDLEAAYAALTAVRPCGPNREAIRGATYDLAYVPGVTPRFSQLPPHAFTDLSPAERESVRARALRSAEGLI